MVETKVHGSVNAGGGVTAMSETTYGTANLGGGLSLNLKSENELHGFKVNAELGILKQPGELFRRPVTPFVFPVNYKSSWAFGINDLSLNYTYLHSQRTGDEDADTRIREFNSKIKDLKQAGQFPVTSYVKKVFEEAGDDPQKKTEALAKLNGELANIAGKLSIALGRAELDLGLDVALDFGDLGEAADKDALEKQVKAIDAEVEKVLVGLNSRPDGEGVAERLNNKLNINPKNFISVNAGFFAREIGLIGAGLAGVDVSAGLQSGPYFTISGNLFLGISGGLRKKFGDDEAKFFTDNGFSVLAGVTPSISPTADFDQSSISLGAGAYWQKETEEFQAALSLSGMGMFTEIWGISAGLNLFFDSIKDMDKLQMAIGGSLGGIIKIKTEKKGTHTINPYLGIESADAGIIAALYSFETDEETGSTQTPGWGGVTTGSGTTGGNTFGVDKLYVGGGVKYEWDGAFGAKFLTINANFSGSNNLKTIGENATGPDSGGSGENSWAVQLDVGAAAKF